MTYELTSGSQVSLPLLPSFPPSLLPLGECCVWDGHPLRIWSCLNLLYRYIALTSCFVGAVPTEKLDGGSSGHTLSIQTWALRCKLRDSHKEPKGGENVNIFLKSVEYKVIDISK